VSEEVSERITYMYRSSRFESKSFGQQQMNEGHVKAHKRLVYVRLGTTCTKQKGCHGTAVEFRVLPRARSSDYKVTVG